MLKKREVEKSKLYIISILNVDLNYFTYTLNRFIIYSTLPQLLTSILIIHKLSLM